MTEQFKVNDLVKVMSYVSDSVVRNCKVIHVDPPLDRSQTYVVISPVGNVWRTDADCLSFEDNH